MKLPTVKSPVQIRFSDLDILGHVSNSIYPQYFEIGRLDWFKAIEEESPMTVVASMTIDFLAEINIKDPIHVVTACIQKGNKSLTLSQDIYCNDQVVTKSTVVIVGFDMETRQTVSLFEGWGKSESVDNKAR